jgi:hypothetical protein
MYARVIGMRFPDYQAWVERKATEIKEAREQAAETRKRIEGQEQ